MGFLSVIGIKGAAIIALILGLAGWLGYNHYQLQAALTGRKAAETERDLAGVARDKAIDANKSNILVMAQLEKEKSDIQLALNALDTDRKKNQKIIADLSTVIRSMATDPANKVQLSPVLQVTIDNIQKQRAARERLP